MKWTQLDRSLNILWHCPSLGLEWNWNYPVLWLLLSFLSLLPHWVQHFNNIPHFMWYNRGMYNCQLRQAKYLRSCCSVAKSCPTLCDSTDCSMPGFPVPHHLLELAHVRVHCICDAIQPSHPLIPSSPSAFSLSQHQGLFQWVSSLSQVAKVLELQLQHQSFQQVFRVDFL